MKPVKEPQYYDLNHCNRCNEEYCNLCVDFETVNFDIIEEQTYNGDKVCPWCYNQLLQKLLKIEKQQ